MLNLKNNEKLYAVVDEMCKKIIKENFKKMKGFFWAASPWLKSHRPPLVYTYNYFLEAIVSKV